MLSITTTISQEDNLETFTKALKSVSFADDIKIYSMELGQKKGSKLRKIAKNHKAQIIKIKKASVVEEVRQKQVQEAKYNWVLVIDFDEVVTTKLKDKILDITHNQNPTVGAYAIRRKNFSLGYPLKYGGWGDDYQLRLLHKDFFLSWPNVIHTTPKFKGKVKKIQAPLLHHKDQSLSYMVKKTNRYSDTEANLFYQGNLSQVTQFTLLRKMLMESFRRGILKLGILDGVIGIIQTIYQGFSVFISYAKLYEKQIKSKKNINN